MQPFRLTLISHLAEETIEIGTCLGKELMPGDLVALTGDLGAGKTCLVQGIAKGLLVPESSYVRSPSFMILNIHEGRCPLYHMDLYRIQDTEELEDIGYREYFFGHGVTAVEWADKIPELLPHAYLLIHLELQDEDTRVLMIEAKGEQFASRRQVLEISLSSYQK